MAETEKDKADDKPKVVAAPPVQPVVVEGKPLATAAGPVNTSSTTVPWGRYVVQGRLVNCNGEPIKD